MSGPRRMLLSASYFESIAAASRHQLRIRRRPIYYSSSHQIACHSRTFSGSVRRLQDDVQKPKKNDDPTTLPEEASTIARKADESLKPSTLKRTEDISPAELRETNAPQSIIDDGAATLPQEISNVARAADEPPKPSDLDVVPDNVPAEELAEAMEIGEVEESDEPSDIEAMDKIDAEIAAMEEAASQDLKADESNSTSSRKKSQSTEDIETATILKHGESEAHMDLREYARLAAWELPLLHKLAKPFEPPTSSEPLRFRYTSYLGDEHPASRKVVVEFKPSDLPDLNEKQQIKLLKLAGTRYNPEKQTVKMSCESFETPAQNKRYLGDLVQKLIAEAKDPKADSFEDIPLDLRHHKPKKIHKFPEEWKITPPSRIAYGGRLRGQGNVKRRMLASLKEKGTLLDGEKIIEEHMARMPVQRVTRPTGEKTVLGSRTGKAPVRRRI